MGMQSTDEEIRSQFESILGSIKTWSMEFKQNSNGPRFDEHRLQDYLKVAPYYQEFKTLERMISGSRNRKAFIRGLAASTMCSLLIRTPHDSAHRGSDSIDHWTDEKTAVSFADLEDTLSAAGKISAL